MKRNHTFIVFIPILVVALSLLTVASAFAQTGTITVLGVNCNIEFDEDDPEYFPTVVYEAGASDGVYFVDLKIINNSNGDSVAATFDFDGDDGFISEEWDTGLGDASTGDDFTVQAELFDDDRDRISDFEGRFGCSNIESTDSYIPAVDILPLAGSQFADNEGNLACGVFDVNGWGLKIIAFDVVPDCTPFTAFEVKCQAGDEGLITGRDIYDVTSNAFEISFESKTHGICGIFPSGPLQVAPLNPTVAPPANTNNPIRSLGDVLWNNRQ